MEFTSFPRASIVIKPQFDSDGETCGLIPSLDGGLYQVNGDKVEPIPFTADTLLGSFYKLPDGSILVGGKQATSCGLNPYSGKVRYICSADGCQLTESDGHHVQDSDVLVLKRTQQTIRAVDQRSGAERWNFSVGQHDVSFLEAVLSENGNGCCSEEDDEVFTEWSLRVSIPNGLVAAVNSHGSKKLKLCYGATNLIPL
ncbi:Eukaryotic translation initiation factor 2-alpha kinase 3 [Desmophyllum pertusum]|uniref:Eukaryotic translation initiation factor 2-alpha kinase 3 n=1 Tax=Desmophyllum pertusum TaxID=174260 RepID=A0A9W9Z4S3_9CNID|nr:Eukaryotic translation initiation factor 2-alpha kinase 3 [Desmophyllum pertusum]